ncbi:transposase [Yersinia enterocolitica]|uniref:Transposase n=41 Tax=Bacteria TaxID=2 RepID=A0A0G2PMV9_YERE1|nr:putative transposase for IS1667 [Yersinia enterocolitica subsp. palearctica 105.5R(r)]ALG76977.1 transposase [Yersinia enterocolitica]EOR69723.1 transposase [Yersinia enterocolitica subsp. palearctica YE-149]EOR75856.1 transposase [Yersinia enterocolitica subsp. palearctica YE-150]EOR76542.1 transposase [Yersinia enterocolitica subsp. palearctica YE-P1]CBY25446.1 transposase [Yersinia enterocolitica subsp. palearctica Y11]CCO67787.1 Mobile element protein [Yersinia enterocolitica IP 10393]
MLKLRRRSIHMKVSTLGIDLAKNVFQLHGVGCNGQTVLKKKLTRDKFLPFLMQLEPCLIGMEACASSHHFARVLRQYGHEVKLIPPQYVKPYVKTNKTDAADAEAICEAVARPNMRFVQIKTAEQQAILVLHTERNILIRERTACANSMRAILAEFGIIMPRTLSQLYKKIPEILEEYDNELSPFVRCSVARQLEHLQGVEDQITLIEQELSRWAKTQPACQRVMKVPGVGLMTATYLVASVGNGQQFHSAKQFAAWLGLVPREFSSGGKQRLGRISKRGDRYFRYLLVHGARAVAAVIERHKDNMPWLYRLLNKKAYNVAVVAQANKTARILWSMLVHHTEYRTLSAV